ncbi:hypothetical protein PV10_08477 [Exophiala mesophila]|uniref:ADA HAT complex component 1 n=1 Tax=Exophiala mesophila TaxID=212818 RepID=A0A0D1Z4I5_EXOME|nr:uncharacterized protein PV10_08477 [Exophiala mesophila]KIV88839.1 hypothetical protein PV10_08477 [Exophiala mesophila]
MSSIPSTAEISRASFQAVLALYPAFAKQAYGVRLKDPKKVAEAVQRDKWRFEDLPSQIAAARNGETTLAMKDIKAGGLTKDALERLVQWKITHGQFRPFLPGMVRKNDPSVIQQQTALAFETLESSDLSSPSTQTIIKALDIVCKLSGIGPATGTLILNLYDPTNVPFFQDELFAWLFPESKGVKLKYNQKEYRQLIEATQPILERLKVTAMDLEKVAYVLGHKDVVDDELRQKLDEALSQSLSSKDEPETGLDKLKGSAPSADREEIAPKDHPQKTRKRPVGNTSNADEEPRKRRSQRGK